jgi:hypothetical protein
LLLLEQVLVLQVLEQVLEQVLVLQVLEQVLEQVLVVERSRRAPAVVLFRMTMVWCLCRHCPCQPLLSDWHCRRLLLWLHQYWMHRWFRQQALLMDCSFLFRTRLHLLLLVPLLVFFLLLVVPQLGVVYHFLHLL